MRLAKLLSVCLKAPLHDAILVSAMCSVQHLPKCDSVIVKYAHILLAHRTWNDDRNVFKQGCHMQNDCPRARSHIWVVCQGVYFFISTCWGQSGVDNACKHGSESHRAKVDPKVGQRWQMMRKKKAARLQSTRAAIQAVSKMFVLFETSEEMPQNKSPVQI